jgi:hypothetical protein
MTRTISVLSLTLAGLVLAVAERPVSAAAPTRAERDAAFIREQVRRLKDKDRRTVLHALVALGKLGTAAKKAAPDVFPLLTHKDMQIQRQAARALAQIGPPALPLLLKSLKDEREQVRMWSAEALSLFGPQAREAAEPLLYLCKDSSPTVRLSALRALPEVSEDGAGVDKALEVALNDAEPVVRLTAALILKQRKLADVPAAPQSAPVLVVPPRLNAAQELALDAVVQAWIRIDSHGDVRGRLPVNKQAGQLFFTLGPEAIPALVRGLNLAYALRTACPMSSINWRLIEVVQQCNDVVLLDHVLLNLGNGLPLAARSQMNNAQYIKQLRAAVVQRKAELVMFVIAEARRRAFARLMEATKRLPEAELKAQLASGRSADERLAAAAVCSARRVRWQNELIDRVADPDAGVSQAARVALIRLARGADLGPSGSENRAEAQRRWRDWWDHQDDNPSPGSWKAAAGLPPSAEARKLAEALASGPPADRDKALARLREAAGDDYTRALASALPRLAGDLKREARQALEARLAKLPAGLLRARLADKGSETRRAAALACAARGERELLPQLVGLLADRHGEVAQAARSALRELTGEDFGPRPKTGAAAGAAAVRRWQAWLVAKSKE